MGRGTIWPGKALILAGIFSILLLLLSRFSRVWLCATPQTAAHQAPPSLGFSRQEHWSGLPFPSPMHESEVAQSCLTCSGPMDCTLSGSSVHGIFQARAGLPLPSPQHKLVIILFSVNYSSNLINNQNDKTYLLSWNTLRTVLSVVLKNTCLKKVSNLCPIST